MKILNLFENYNDIKSANTKGKCLADLIKDDYVVIYRAQPKIHLNIPSDSYVTRSLRFAKDHAVHMANTEEEPFHVVRGFVKTINVYEASNPGEYIYTGKDVKARSIFVANIGDDFIQESALADHDYKLKLERKLSYFLRLRKDNKWKQLAYYENEQKIISELLKLALKFRDKDVNSGYEDGDTFSENSSHIIDQFIATFNLNFIQTLSNIDYE